MSAAMTVRGGLSTHVLDLTRGKPAAGMTIELWFAGTHLKTVVTNADGRTDTPLVEADALAAGDYELIFHVGDYFDRPDAFDRADAVPDHPASSSSRPHPNRFLDRVPVRFHVHDTNARYHVPLLCTPWAYSTYRGS
jgi:5-hydroxyisourate hydrolase